MKTMRVALAATALLAVAGLAARFGVGRRPQPAAAPVAAALEIPVT